MLHIQAAENQRERESPKGSQREKRNFTYK